MLSVRLDTHALFKFASYTCHNWSGSLYVLLFMIVMVQCWFGTKIIITMMAESSMKPSLKYQENGDGEMWNSLPGCRGCHQGAICCPATFHLSQLVHATLAASNPSPHLPSIVDGWDHELLAPRTCRLCEFLWLKWHVLDVLAPRVETKTVFANTNKRLKLWPKGELPPHLTRPPSPLKACWG